MKSSGTIIAFNTEGNRIATRRYGSKPHRREILKEWKKMFARLSFYQIEPDTYEDYRHLTIKEQKILERLLAP